MAISLFSGNDMYVKLLVKCVGEEQNEIKKLKVPLGKNNLITCRKIQVVKKKLHYQRKLPEVTSFSSKSTSVDISVLGDFFLTLVFLISCDRTLLRCITSV